MKCWICGKEMENTIGGCYHCKDCGTEINDAVLRQRINVLDDLTVRGTVEPITYQEGWVCPKCGGVYSPYQNCCPNCTPAKPIHATCETNKPYIPPTQTISKVNEINTTQTISKTNETHSNLDSNVHLVGKGIDTSDRMNNFKQG